MQITSPVFLFLFLPLTLLLFHCAPVKLRSWALLAFSAGFYIWGELGYGAVICASIFLNYLAALFLERFSGRTRQMIFWGAVAINLLLLSWFKYSSFMLTTLTSTMGLEIPFFNGGMLPGHLPLGISFFTFLAISYLTDVHNEICPASRNLKETALYFLFFPRVTSGPLIRFQSFCDSLVPAAFFSEEFAAGVRRFIIGLARKVLLATPLMKAANCIFDAPAGTVDMPTAWLGAILYSLMIYHDFAGYSDMAIGLSRMLGYQLPENFEYPYTALSFTDFWRRWHITLSGWLRDYLFIPLSRALVTERFRERLACGEATMLSRNCLSICCVFTICGLWHGAGWNFIVWGLAHGLFLSFEQTAAGKRLAMAPVVVRRFYLLASITLTWTLFRLESLRTAGSYIKTMVLPTFSPAAPNVWTGELVVVVASALLFSFPFSRDLANLMPVKARDILHAPIYLLLLVITISAVASGSFNPFIYARF